MSETPQAAGSRRRKAAILGIVLVVLAAALLAYLALHRTPADTYTGAVEIREIQVGSKIGGRVTQVPVDDGQRVKAGELLVRFEADQLTAEQAQAQAQLAQAQANLAKMQRGYRPEEIQQAQADAAQQLALLKEARNGPREQEIRQAQADFAAAQADAHDAQVTFDRMAMLVRGETVSRQQYDDAKAQHDAKEQQAEGARQRLALLQAGTRAEDIEAAQQRYEQAAAQARMTARGYRREDIDAAKAQLEAARAQVASLQAQLREAALFAPADGVIETVSIRAGDLVPPGQIVMTMLEDSELWVRIYVPETELSRVRLNQRASVTVDAARGRSFAGHVEEIASEAEFLPRNVQTRDDRAHEVFSVKVRVEEPAGVLKSGMAATVRLE